MTTAFDDLKQIPTDGLRRVFPFAYACRDIRSSTVISCLVPLFGTFGLPSFVHSDRGSSIISDEIEQFLHEKGVATSQTTLNNPRGNGQVERLNGTLWKAIMLSLRSKGHQISHRETGLQDASHSIRSLLCTATNATPHERMFHHNRKSAVGTSLPQWLLSPGPVLMRRNIQSSKYDPVVEKVELLKCNPEYAYVRHPNSMEEPSPYVTWGLP